MTRENLKKVIDPLFALTVFFLVLFIGVSVWNNMIIGKPVEIPIDPMLVALIFLLGMGTGKQIEKLKKRRRQSRT